MVTSSHRWHCDKDPHDAHTPIWHTHKSSDEMVACVPECVCVSKTKKIFPSNESSTQPADVNENDVFVA